MAAGGPYHLIRHPSYAGACIQFISTPLLLGHWWALIAFGNSWRIGIDEKSADALVTNGIFALSRNPIFAFIDLYFIGTFLINGTLVFLVFAVVTVLALHYQILQEEKFLLSKYCQAYQVYRLQAGRYLNLKAVLQILR